VRQILKSRFIVYFGTLLAQAQNVMEKEAIFNTMEKSKAGKELLSQFQLEEDSEMTPVQDEPKQKPTTTQEKLLHEKTHSLRNQAASSALDLE